MSLVAAEATMTVCADAILRGHLHEVQCIPHQLRHLLVLCNPLDATLGAHAGGVCKLFSCQVPHFRCILDTTVLEKGKD